MRSSVLVTLWSAKRKQSWKNKRQSFTPAKTVALSSTFPIWLFNKHKLLVSFFWPFRSSLNWSNGLRSPSSLHCLFNTPRGARKASKGSGEINLCYCIGEKSRFFGWKRSPGAGAYIWEKKGSTHAKKKQSFCLIFSYIGCATYQCELHDLWRLVSVREIFQNNDWPHGRENKFWSLKRWCIRNIINCWQSLSNEVGIFEPKTAKSSSWGYTDIDKTRNRNDYSWRITHN